MSIEKAGDEFDDHFRRAFFLQLADKLGPRISDESLKEGIQAAFNKTLNAHPPAADAS